MMKYLAIIGLFVFLLNGCSDRDYGEQDITKVPSALSTKQVSILSSVPKKNIAQSSYISVEFSSFMDKNSFASGEIELKNSATNTGIELVIDVEENRLYIKPQQSLVVGESYTLTIDSKATDIMGNSIDKAYERTFTCVSKFWKEVEVGETHSMARSIDGDIYVWGSNSYKELQIKNTKSRATPLGILDSNESLLFNAGTFTSGFINQDATLRVEGSQSIQNSDSLFTTLSIGKNHSSVIKEDGTLWSWGRNNSGQLGNQGIIHQDELTQEYTNASNWKSVSAGDNFSVAIKSDGTLWGWGKNEYGQIGNARYNEKRVPVQEDTNATDWIMVSAGTDHTVALKSDGSIWSWGYNAEGQLGNDSNNSSRVAVQEAKKYSWRTVSAGSRHTVAIKDDGSLWAWGSNYYGQLGDNTITDKRVPTLIDSNKWISVSCGRDFTIGIQEDGTIWAWGYNAQKQLGLGENENDKLIPTEIK